MFSTSAEMLVTGILEQAIRSSFNFSRRVVQAQVGQPSVAALHRHRRATRSSAHDLFDTEPHEDEEPWLIDRLFPQVRLSKFSGTLIRDSRDRTRLLDPSQRHAGDCVTGDLAARAIGSEVGFVKTYLQGFDYHQLPAPRRIVLALGARVGLAHGFNRERPIGRRRACHGGTIDGLPASERFFAGGDTTVRGFALDRLGNERTISDHRVPDRRQQRRGVEQRAARAAVRRVSGHRLSRCRQRLPAGQRSRASPICARPPASAWATDHSARPGPRRPRLQSEPAGVRAGRAGAAQGHAHSCSDNAF